MATEYTYQHGGSLYLMAGLCPVSAVVDRAARAPSKSLVPVPIARVGFLRRQPVVSGGA